MRPAIATVLLLAVFAGPVRGQGFAIPGSGATAEAPAQRTCFSAAETRDKILSDKLAEPFPLLRAQAAEHRAEAIGVRLCDRGGALTYEIDLLRKDGRLIHSNLDARTGKPAPGRQ